MKKSIILLFVLLKNLSFGQTVYPSGVSGCLARWTFDTTEVTTLSQLTDQSGNGNNGSATNIGSAFGFRNKPFSAGAFDGITSFGEVAHKTSLNPANITIISLIKFNGFYNGLCQGNNVIYKGFDYNSNLSWAMFVSDIDGNCSAFDSTLEKLSFLSSGSPTYVPPSSNFISSQKWYFLATTFNGSQINYYQIEMDTSIKATNITPLYTNNSTVPLGNTTHDIFVGATQNPPFKYWFNGSIDELILFDKALSDSEIQSVYDYLWGTPLTTSDFLKNNNWNPFIIDQNLKVNYDQTMVKEISIFDINGRLLYRTKKAESSIDLKSYSHQILILNIKLTDNNTLIKKVMY